jgi:hypothetical protein
MRRTFGAYGIRLPRGLHEDVRTWIAQGVTAADVTYACREAATHGAHNFVYVSTVIQRLQDELGVGKVSAVDDDSNVVDFERYCQRG